MCKSRCGPVRAYPLSYPYLADPDSSITYLSAVTDPVPTRELVIGQAVTSYLSHMRSRKELDIRDMSEMFSDALRSGVEVAYHKE